MIILGIETSGHRGSVALCEGERVLAGFTFPEGPRHARDVVAAVERVVAESGVGKASVQAVAASEGPGAFTGLRVGITCAKVLAWALGWQCVGVPSLDVLAQNVAPGAAGGDGLICPILDARRGMVYAAVFRREGARWAAATGVMLKEPAKLAAELPDGTVVFGPGVRAYGELFGPPRFRPGPPEWDVGRAEWAARLGLELVRLGRAVDPMALVPKYYRLTEAEEKLPPAGPARGR